VGQSGLLGGSQLLQHFFAFFQNQVALFLQRRNRRHSDFIGNHALAFEFAILRRKPQDLADFQHTAALHHPVMGDP